MRNDGIAIIGAGPAGTSCALALAKKGIPSTLIDKAVFPRDKVCGDAISGKTVEFLKRIDPAIMDSFIQSDIQLGSYGVTFVAPNNKPLRIPFNKNAPMGSPAPGFISKRLDFDEHLFEFARKQPLIQVLEGVHIKEYRKTSSGYQIRSSNGKEVLNARLLIIANGAQSGFSRNHAGLSVNLKHNCAGIRAYYKNVDGLDKQNFIELHFLKEVLPGYFWIFPLPNGMANIGLGMRSDHLSKKKINLKELLNQITGQNPTIKKRFENAEQIGGIKGFGLPLGSVKRKISGDHYLLTGDAGALIDPFTGEGIGNAVISGYLAAEQAQKSLESNNYSGLFMYSYDKSVYKRLGSELKLSYKLQQLVRYPWLFNLVVNKAEKNRNLQDLISSMFEDLDLRSRLKRPSFYFDLLFK